jgi:hypothetical protein
MMIERYSIGMTDIKGVFGTGGTGLSGQQITSSLPIAVQIQTDVALIKYILQRTVPDYDEIVKQFNALEDIKGAEQWDK